MGVNKTLLNEKLLECRLIMITIKLFKKPTFSLFWITVLFLFSWDLWLKTPLSGELVRPKTFINFLGEDTADERRFLRANFYSDKYLTVGAHGVYVGSESNVRMVKTIANGETSYLNPVDFGLKLKVAIKKRGLNQHLPIFLASCGTGKNSVGIAYAQNLSDVMGVAITAPVNYLSVSSIGEYWTTASHFENVLMMLSLKNKRQKYKTFYPSNS